MNSKKKHTPRVLLKETWKKKKKAKEKCQTLKKINKKREKNTKLRWIRVL